MGYMHIENLYKNQDILLFKECYALEKIHGTSAHILWNSGEVKFFAGGESHEKFVALFDKENLAKVFTDLLHKSIRVYGEAHGGKQQGMKKTYGEVLKFVAFDVQVGDSWLSVPKAEEVVLKLGLEFVDYAKIPTTLEALDAEKNKDSVQAIRNGVGAGKLREGVVLRPLIEVTKNNGHRIISKHKRDEFRETATPRTISPEQLVILEDAEKIANEWVTAERLRHVLQKFPADSNVEITGDLIKAMIEDVYREGAGEIVESKSVKSAIGKKTASMFVLMMKQALKREETAVVETE